MTNDELASKIAAFVDSTACEDRANRTAFWEIVQEYEKRVREARGLPPIAVTSFRIPGTPVSGG